MARALLQPAGSTATPIPTRYRFYFSYVRQAEKALALSLLPSYQASSNTSLSSSSAIQGSSPAASTPPPVATEVQVLLLLAPASRRDCYWFATASHRGIIDRTSATTHLDDDPLSLTQLALSHTAGPAQLLSSPAVEKQPLPQPPLRISQRYPRLPCPPSQPQRCSHSPCQHGSTFPPSCCPKFLSISE